MGTKIIYLGSNWEALATLKTLHEDKRFEIVALITQPDKPAGRNQLTTESEIKKYAEKESIPVFYTLNNKDRYSQALETFEPELIVCKSFGEIIPENFLEAPKFKAVNIHFSLLPEYRGAVPIQKAILDGKLETGISIVKMVAELDAGPIIAQFKEAIQPDDTNETLRKRLVQTSSKVIGNILEDWIKGKIVAEQQNDNEATYCWKADISKEKAEISWSKDDPDRIARMIRAFTPWPVAWTQFKGKRLKIFSARLINRSRETTVLKPGQFWALNEKVFIGTKDPNKLIQPLQVQLEGKVAMEASEFMKGRKF